MHLHMMYTMFIVYTYVIQTYCCVMTVHFPLILNFSEVYTNSIHSLGALQHYNSWNFTGMLHTLAQCCLDDGQRIFTISYLDSWTLSLGCSLRIYRVHYIVIVCLCNVCYGIYMLCIMNMWVLKFHGLYQTYT